MNKMSTASINFSKIYDLASIDEIIFVPYFNQVEKMILFLNPEILDFMFLFF
jgi:hypothetical protein